MEKLFKKEVSNKAGAVKSKEFARLDAECIAITDIEELDKHLSASEKFVKKACAFGDFESAFKAAKEGKDFERRYYEKNPDEHYDENQANWDAWLSSGAHTPPPEDEPEEDIHSEIFVKIAELASKAGNFKVAEKIANDSYLQKTYKVEIMFEIINLASKAGKFEYAMELAEKLPKDSREYYDSNDYEGFERIAVSASNFGRFDLALKIVRDHIKDIDAREGILTVIVHDLEGNKRIGAEEKERFFEEIDSRYGPGYRIFEAITRRKSDRAVNLISEIKNKEDKNFLIENLKFKLKHFEEYKAKEKKEPDIYKGVITKEDREEQKVIIDILESIK